MNFADPKQGLAPGCCSAVSPCSHQRQDPATICDVCRKAARLTDAILGTPTNTASSPAGRGDWPHLSPQEIVRRTRCQADDWTVSGNQAVWRQCCDLILNRLGPVLIASPDPAGAGGDLGELERLSAGVNSAEWWVDWVVEDGSPFIRTDGDVICCGVEQLSNEDNARTLKFICAVVNALRSGKLVASSQIQTDGDGRTSASPLGSGWSSSTEPKVSALTGDHPSRGQVDYDELNRLYALMPEGPWQDMRSTGGHEIRQIDTDPTNKHHWPFRLCQSIAGQRAACDDAVFAFIAGVLNAWPAIAAANFDDAYIDRVMAMPEDELRKRFLVDGQSPEQAETISRQAFDIAVLKVALTQIHSQYIINRGDMTNAEALGAIEKIAAKALGAEAEGQDTEGGLVHEGPADLSATPEPSPQSSPTLKTGAMTVEGWEPLKTAPQDGEVFLVASIAGTGPTLCSFTDGYFRLVSNRAKLAGYGIWFWHRLPVLPDETALRTIQGEADHG